MTMPEPGPPFLATNLGSADRSALRVLTRQEVEAAKVRLEDLLALARSHEQQLVHCPLCGHEWRRHDPEDGMCDAGMPQALDHDDFGPCPCGRDLVYMQRRIAALSSAALSAGEEKP